MLAFVVLFRNEDTLAEEVLVDLLALASGNKHLDGCSGCCRKKGRGQLTGRGLQLESEDQNVWCGIIDE